MARFLRLVRLSAATAAALGLLPVATGSADVSPPAAVIAHVQAMTTTSISLAWAPPADPGTVTGYQVDYSTDHGGTWTAEPEIQDPSATTATLSDLSVGVAYDVRVSAMGPGGDGPTTLVNGVRSITDNSDLCFTLNTDSVRCARYDYSSDTTSLIDVPALESSTEISGSYVLCGLRTNGDVTCDGKLTPADGPNGLVEGLPSNVVHIAVGDNFGCALTADGAVYCWGDNHDGQLGIGSHVPNRSGTAVLVQGLPPVSELAAGGRTACVISGQSQQVMCWGDDTYGQIGDGGGPDRYSPVPVTGMTGASRVMFAGPSVCAALRDTPSQIDDYCWSWTHYGYSPAPVHLVEQGYTDIAWYGADGDELCAVAPSGGICNGTQSRTTVAVGVGGGFECAQSDEDFLNCEHYNASHQTIDPSAVITAGPFVPASPSDLKLDSLSGSQATVSWLVPQNGGTAVTGYLLERSTDGGETWTTLDDHLTSTSATVTGPASGRAYLYRVRARNDIGLSEPSDELLMTPGGTGPQQITIQAPNGTPVSGGSVTWESTDGATESALPSALTADGVLTFARVVVGPATVTIKDGVLPTGSTVSGSWPVILGTDPQVLQLPTVPNVVTRTVTVTLPNDVPVVDASVRGALGYSSSTCAYSSNFSFCGGVHRQVLTDGDGAATISGWSTGGQPSAQVVYSDGVLAQRQTVALSEGTTAVQLQYMPWLTVNADGSPVDVGQLSSLAFTVNDEDGSASADSPTAASPVSITVKPPAGWTARRCARRSVLSGTTNSAGRLTLHVCASASGLYRVISHGAVTAKSVFLRVRGAAPMTPTSVTTRSPAPGVLQASWGAPVYSGGAPITAYRLTASSPHQPSRTVTVPADGRPWTPDAMRHRFTGLASGRSWVLNVQAVTRHGTSRVTSATVTVA